MLNLVCACRGNQFLWGYDTSQDAELQEVFNFVVSRGVNLFDTADSYGEVVRPACGSVNRSVPTLPDWALLTTNSDRAQQQQHKWLVRPSQQ